MSFITDLKNLSSLQGEEYKAFNGQLDHLLKIMNDNKKTNTVGDKSHGLANEQKPLTIKTNSYLELWKQAALIHGFQNVKKTDTEKYNIVKKTYEELKQKNKSS